ncbi:alginate lyase family protein [Xanthomonas graminis]|uniref:alginate lyase family protein n=1 Tax=Xanthomonas graminis TaxID=3390026 RepID=UPI001F46222B|nr:alginate lyase family protein [Xanthomonas translucens]UKE73427.1 alginate lyase family protein [Xanthomonas translucens pv. phleipratensis]
MSFAGLRASLAIAVLALSPCAPAIAMQRLWPTEQQWRQLGTDSDAAAAQLHLADAALHDTAHPIAVLSTAGRLKGDPAKADTEASLGDMRKIQALAVAYALTGEGRYATKAGDYLSRWAAVNQPSGEPIDETGLEPAIFAYRIVRNELPTITRHDIDHWMRRIARAEIASRDPKRKTATNNWHSHRLKSVGLIGIALDDDALIAYARDGLKQQIGDNLRPDGRSIDFIARDALSYHVYDLRPLVTLALAFSERGEDLYHWQARNGASLAHSVQWLLPYLRGDKPHAEFVGSDVAFDKARSRNGEAGHVIGSTYAPRDALPLLSLTAAYDPDSARLATQLGGSTADLRLALSLLPTRPLSSAS